MATSYSINFDDQAGVFELYSYRECLSAEDGVIITHLGCFDDYGQAADRERRMIATDERTKAMNDHLSSEV